MDNDSCDCGFDEEFNGFPTNPMYGQSYVPIQTMDRTFTPCVGLRMGTIFPELVSPYSPCQSIEENAFIKAKMIKKNIMLQKKLLRPLIYYPFLALSISQE